MSKTNTEHYKKLGLYLMVDNSISILESTEYFENLLGYSADELKGKKLLDFCEGLHSVEKLNSIMDEFLKNDLWNGELAFKTKKGNIKWAQIFLSKDKESKVHNYAMGIDITKYKRVEDYSILSEAALGVGNWEVDLASQTLYWSDAVHKIHETDPQVFVPNLETAIDFYADWSKPIIGNLVKESIETGVDYKVDLQIVTAKGNLKWIRTVGASEVVDGKPTRFYGAFQDIDEEKKFQNELKEKKERLDLATSAGKIGIWDWNMKENILYWDDYLFDLYGLDKANFSNAYEAWESCIYPEDKERAVSELNRVLRDKLDLDISFRVIRGDGDIKHIRSKGKTHYDDAGAPVRMIGCNWDETLQKETEGRMIEARERALEATSFKSKFLASMSHEIRTPMNGVIGMTDLLFDTKLDAEQKNIVKTIHDCGEGLLSIVNDILDISKIEAGKLTLDAKNMELKETLNNVYALFSYPAKEKGLDYSLEIHPSVPRNIFQDSVRLRQVLSNLIGNAIKFTRKGEVKVIVETKPRSKGGTNLHFRIEDSGLGISSDSIDQLFKPFSQVHKDNSENYGGTGLGLSICKKLVELMGGNISVESIEGRGSVFKFYIPTTIAHLQNQVVSSTSADTVKENINILLAEDNFVNQKLAEAYFSKMGYQIDIVENGADAFEKAQVGNYDFIFMDLQMPVMDGIEATKKIRSLKLRKEPIIVAMTANVFKEDKDHCFSAGMDDFLGKPVKLREIKEVLMKNTTNKKKTA